MAVLLLCCAAPMQAWGSRSRFGERDTERDPTKSGIVGLLCAALGKPRIEAPGDGFPTIEELARLRMGVRVDREGIIRRDFHTAGGGKWGDEPYGVAKSSGGKGDTVISNRYYLADAAFLVGLEGSLDLLQRLHNALDAPVWMLCLGRKAFVPGMPVQLPGKSGLLADDVSLERALRRHPQMLKDDMRRRQENSGALRFVLDWRPNDRDDAGLILEASASRQDTPVSFAPGARTHQVRRIREFHVPFDQLFQEAKQ